MEEVICSVEEMLRSKRKNRGEQGLLADLPVYMIPYAPIRKTEALKNISKGCRESKDQI